MVSLCQMLVGPSTGLVRLLNFRIRSRISKQRISNFMEIDSEAVSNRTDNQPKGTLTLQNYSATWVDPVQAEKLRNLDPTKKNTANTQGQSTKQAILTLDNVSITFEPGKLYIILGSVGSSKSSLIHALLGELSTVHGRNEVSGSIGYVPQTAFNNNDILRNNITYGREFDLDLYVDTVIKCGLYDDLEMFPSRDYTEIGERGINLSGGQKQRIGLARAVYSQPDILLIDDSFSALDKEVGVWVWNQIIQKPRKSDGVFPTRIVVTHDYELARQADEVVVMQNGKIGARGRWNDLVQRAQNLSDETDDSEARCVKNYMKSFEEK